MVTVKIDIESCNGCGVCIDTCPTRVLEIEENKVKIVKDMSECLGCRACESACPEGAIVVED